MTKLSMMIISSLKSSYRKLEHYHEVSLFTVTIADRNILHSNAPTSFETEQNCLQN